MANVLIFDVVTKRAKEYRQSVNTPDFEGREDVVINPVLPDAEFKYIKVEGGQALEMSQAEKDALLAEEAQALQDAIAAALVQAKIDAKNYIDNGQDADRKLVKALAWVIFNSMVETRNKVNELITDQGSSVAPLPSRTWTQLKTAVKNEIDQENAS